MPAELILNGATTTLASGAGAADATIAVASTAGMSAAGQSRLLIDAELLLVTGISGTTLTVTRGIEGTAAATHAAGATVYANELTAASFTAVIDYAPWRKNVLGKYGAVADGTTDASGAFTTADADLGGVGTVVAPRTANPYAIATTITLHALDLDGALSIASGKTVTIAGPFRAPARQVFSGAGRVVFASGAVAIYRPEWFGWAPAASYAANTAAFAACAASLPADGGEIQIPPGSYNGSLSLPASAANVTVQGKGATIKPTGTDTGLVAVTPVGLKMYDLEIDCSGQTGTAHGVYVSGATSLALRNCHIHHPHDHGVFVDGGTDPSVAGCHIHHCGNGQPASAGAGSGVFARGFTRLSVTASHVHDCPNQYSHGIIAQADAAANAWTEVTIANNLVETCGGNYAGGGGIAVASSASSLTYRGTKATITGNVVSGSGDGGIWINADEATVVANVVDGTLYGWPIEVEDCQIATISGNTARNGQQDNIMVWQGPTPQQTMRRIVITDNVVEGSVTGNGLNVAGTISQVIVEGNTFCANHLSGASVGNNEQAAIIGNTASGNGSSGIVVTGVTDFVLAGNICADNEQVATGVGGLRVYGGAHGTVTGNRCGDTRAGASKTQTYGLQLDNATDYLTVANNDFQANKTGTILNNATASTHNQIFGDPTGGSTPTPGASTWSYTAGPRPETLYFSGGSGVTVFISGFTSGLTALPIAVQLGPNQAIAVQYTTVPTVNRDIH